jgi:hypothetical protein
MQLVYILGTGSTWADNELRYSLRSACQYYPHTRVLVVGHRPAWLRGVEHLAAHDVYPSGVANVIHKLSKAVHAGVLEDEVTLMNDDFLFLQPVVGELPTYTRGTLADRVARMDHHNAYRVMHERCLAQLRAWGIAQPLDYGTHTPMRMRRAGMLDVLHRVPGTHMADVKMHRTWSLPSGKPMVSMDDAVVHEPAFQAWVGRRFAEACRYEA